MFKSKGLIAIIEQDSNKNEKDISFSHKDPRQKLNLINSYTAKPKQTWKRADKLLNDKPSRWLLKCYTTFSFKNKRTKAVNRHTTETQLWSDGKATLAELKPVLNVQRDEDCSGYGRVFEGFRADCIRLD